jgi:hypothetical protein
VEELGLWNYIHATSSGCASIMVWEGSRAYLHGAIALVATLGFAVTMGIGVHFHRKHLKQARRGPAPATRSDWDEEPTLPEAPMFLED